MKIIRKVANRDETDRKVKYSRNSEDENILVLAGAVLSQKSAPSRFSERCGIEKLGNLSA